MTNCRHCGKEIKRGYTSKEGTELWYCQSCSIDIDFKFSQNFLKDSSGRIVDDFKTNGKTASISKSDNVTDWQITDIIQYVDEHTKTDDEFYSEFTHLVFAHFGWSCYPKKEAV